MTAPRQRRGQPSPGPAARPSLELLRELSDEHVLRALMDETRLTRAELAARTGISKPTVGESVRRLKAAGVVADTGARSTGRGRAGSDYALAGWIGCALAVSIAPGASPPRSSTLHGVGRGPGDRARPPAGPGRSRVTGSVREGGRLVTAPRSPRAGPPGRGQRRRPGRPGSPARLLAVCPTLPFLLGGLSPAQALADLVAGPVLVDNDVNWAARAERAAAGAGPMDDFTYLYLGKAWAAPSSATARSAGAMAASPGESPMWSPPGPGGRAMAFIDVFGGSGASATRARPRSTSRR